MVLHFCRILLDLGSEKCYSEVSHALSKFTYQVLFKMGKVFVNLMRQILYEWEKIYGAD